MDRMELCTAPPSPQSDYQQQPLPYPAGALGAQLGQQGLSADWQACYGHPVLVVETFVDPAQFCGTVYSASGWTELGQTDGWGRRRRDYYVKHDQPKRLFCRQLWKNACRSLQAEHLKPTLAVVEQKIT